MMERSRSSSAISMFLPLGLKDFFFIVVIILYFRGPQEN